MVLNLDDSKPIYVQISEWIETEILSGELQRDDKVYSQYQLAEMFNINPATAAKGLNILAEENILYKKRGLGMFVTESAVKTIRNKRINHTLKNLIQDVVLEAERLNIDKDELLNLIDEEFEDKGGRQK